MSHGRSPFVSTEEITEAELVEDSAVELPRWTEFLVTVALVALSDVTIYRSCGYSGFAAFLVLAPLLLLIGAPRRRLRFVSGLLSGMLLLLAVRLVWYGAPLQVCAGVILVLAFAASLAGVVPDFFLLSLFTSRLVPAGYRALFRYWQSIQGVGPRISRSGWLNVALPLAAFLAFSWLFVLANPDVVTFLGEKVEMFLRSVRTWIVDITLRPTEMLFWFAAAWIGAGLLRPIVDRIPARRVDDSPSKDSPAPLYVACRNTLVTVILLFACYLVFEFKMLWLRAFPDGFYYAGYAHEGAAWLTVALALATVILSVIFRGSILRDPRLFHLRRLAWIWSAQNVLLAVAVYNRLWIYVGFNGMTRMRIVGFFGISAVVAGFALVVWKIARDKNFSWLVRRQIWALAVTIYVFAVTPVDRLAVSYNVSRILQGDVEAVMQIGVQPLDEEGILAVMPLLECSDETIREGVKALLAARLQDLERRDSEQKQQGWTARQLAEQAALRKLRALRGHLRDYGSRVEQEAMLQRFHDYAYQWY